MSAAQSRRFRGARGSSVCASGAGAYRLQGQSLRALLEAAGAELSLKVELAWRYPVTLFAREEGAEAGST